MFVSKKKLKRIIEEEKAKERDRIWQEQDRQRENEIIHKRLDELQTQVWKLREEIEKRNRKRKLETNNI